MKISAFKVKKSATIDLGDGLKVTIAPLAGNKEYRDKARSLGRPHRHVLRRGDGNPARDALIDSIAMEATADHVLLGWENLQDDKGNNVPFSPAKALEYFKEFPTFFETIVGLAADESLFSGGDTDATFADSVGN